MMKVGLGYDIRLQYHVIMRKNKGMADMQSQEFRGMADTG
jgi:hypothetical protein